MNQEEKTMQDTKKDKQMVDFNLKKIEKIN